VDDNKWFRLLWRVNAVLILLVLVVGIGAHSYKTVRGWFREPYYISSNVMVETLDESGDTVLKAEWRYGDPKEMPGAPGFIVPLHRVVRERDPSGYRGYRLTNLLFVDAGLGVTRWLLPDNEKHISHYELLTYGEGEEKRPLAILCEIMEESDIVDEETGDKIMKPSVYLARPDGTGLVRIIECVERRIDHAVADESHLVVFYVKGNMGHAARIGLSDFSVAGSTTLQPIE